MAYFLGHPVYLIFPIANLEAQQLMTSQRSRIEYLIPTDNILVLLLHSNFILKSSLIDGFSIGFNDNSEVAFFLLDHPVYLVGCMPFIEHFFL